MEIHDFPYHIEFIIQISQVYLRTESTARGPITEAKQNTGLSKKMDGIWNCDNLKSTGRIYTFGVLKCSEKFKGLDLP